MEKLTILRLKFYHKHIGKLHLRCRLAIWFICVLGGMFEVMKFKVNWSKFYRITILQNSTVWLSEHILFKQIKLIVSRFVKWTMGLDELVWGKKLVGTVDEQEFLQDDDNFLFLYSQNE